MYLANITGSITQNTPVTFSNPSLTTNDNVIMNSTNTGLLIISPGVYKVRAQMNLTSTGTEIGAAIVANGDTITQSSVTVTLGSGDDGEIITEYPVTVTSALSPQQALVQINALASANLINGFVTVERIS